eukprot:3882338-Lingulodinium_polyedra.AAC.1
MPGPTRARAGRPAASGMYAPDAHCGAAGHPPAAAAPQVCPRGLPVGCCRAWPPLQLALLQLLLDSLTNRSF